MFGKLLSAPVRLVNAPLRTVENIVGCEDEEEREVSRPLESLAKELERAIDGDQDD